LSRRISPADEALRACLALNALRQLMKNPLDSLPVTMAAAGHPATYF
jgi:hypothetical protein